MIKPLYSYDQIRLFPKYFSGVSRNNLDTTIKLGKHTFNVPVVPANMVCCINEDLAFKLMDNGYFYVMHRFGNTLEFIKSANQCNWSLISISVGVKEEDYKLIDIIKKDNLKVDFITIDIAHGHTNLMKQMIVYTKLMLPNVFIIAGNVCTKNAVENLTSWGADAIKVGIAQGGACTTHGKTGFGLPMFSCVWSCCHHEEYSLYDSPIPIIADGGIKTNGDIAKALAAGATMIMAGSMFAALKDSPAEMISDTLFTTQDYFGKRYYKKRYFGSASIYNGNTKHIEGTIIDLPLDDHIYLEKLNEIQQDLKSAISYAGGKDLKAFRYIEYGYTN